MHKFIQFQSGEKVRLPDPIPGIWPDDNPAQSERTKKLIDTLRSALGGSN